MNKTDHYASWCEIYPSRIEHNCQRALALLPPKTRFCAVLKADAYGHGIENVVPILIRHGITHIGITSNAEAKAVRSARFAGTLMRLRTATIGEAEQALAWGVQEQVSTLSAARGFTHLMEKHGRAIELHLSLNAGGMSRDGLELECVEARQQCREILALAAAQVVGLCTHFPCHEMPELHQSIVRFHKDVDWVMAQGYLHREKITIHAGSTITLLSHTDPGVDMMRCGAVLYGIAGSEQGFSPSMALKASVTSVGCFPKGSTIGYDRAVTLMEAKRLANVSLGYSNGYTRQFTGRSQVIIRGQLLPVLGKISMNTIVVDVSQLSNIMPGDEVVAFGHQQSSEITASMVEAQSGTILADLYTDWGHRNPRVLSLEPVENHRTVAKKCRLGADISLFRGA